MVEEEIVRLIKRIIDERVGSHGVILLNVEKANELAVEMGLDAGCVKSVFESLNRMLEEKFRSRKSDVIP